ncbi:MAG TPA: maleylpyruvate isomerase family mycothiol-dependent enzyme [Acidimicrobiales bacterium]|nr:maleylpyruvate isomerase family mycothiol-dependent enzyme [Acidimicrobiales bacterium]
MPDRAFIDQLAEIWRSTAAACEGLSPEQWNTMTDCPGWTVRDQLSHVIGTESSLLGRPAPDPAPAGLPHVHNPMGELNEAWVEPRRRLPGDDVLAEFREVTGARVAALRAMTDEELEVESPSPLGVVPYATFMDVRVMDCWTHEQDIRLALGRPGHLEGAAPAAAIRRLVSSLGYVVGKRVGASEGSTVVLELAPSSTGSTASTVAVVVRDGRAQPTDPPADPTVRITTDAETYARLAAGRWTGDHAIAEGRVTFKGDDALGRRVVDNMSITP